MPMPKSIGLKHIYNEKKVKQPVLVRESGLEPAAL
jgi:hypothetical protein